MPEAILAGMVADQPESLLRQGEFASASKPGKGGQRRNETALAVGARNDPRLQAAHSPRIRNVVTNALSSRHVTEMVNASAFAEAQGLGLNAHVIVRLEDSPRLAACGLPWLRAAVTRTMRGCVARWAPGHGFAAIRVAERTTRSGLHLHIAAHLPDELRRPIAAALAHELMVPDDGVAIRITAARRSGPAARLRLLRYLLKGAEPIFAERIGLEAQPEGLVAGERCRATMNIGPAARRAAGWQEIRKPAALARALGLPGFREGVEQRRIGPPTMAARGVDRHGPRRVPRAPAAGPMRWVTAKPPPPHLRV